MFHLYFGAFDLVLYFGATYFAIVFADAICDSLERPKAAIAKADTALTETALTTNSLHTIPHPRSKRESVEEKVTIQFK